MTHASRRPEPSRRDLESTLDGLIAVAVAAMSADCGALYLLDPADGDLRLVAAQGLSPTAIGHRLAPGEGLTGRVAAEGRSLVSPDVTLDPRAVRRRPDWDEEPVARAYLGVPLRAGAATIGALELTSYHADAFSVSDRGDASILADAAALLIEQTRLQEQPPTVVFEGEPLSGTDPIGVATLNRELRITHANTAFARLVGLAPEALIGRPVLAILPDLGRPLARDALAAALHGTPGHVGDMRATGEGGRDERLSLSLLPLGDPARGVDGVLLGVQDISERFRLEAELREQHARALEAMDRLRAVVQVVSHELRTPLTSILGYAHLLHDRDDADAERRKHWARLVIEKSRLMARLVDDVTDLARLDAGRVTIRREEEELGEVVRQAVDDVAADAGRHTFRLDMPAGLPLIPLDRDRISQVMTNLLGNAVKFWPEGGEVVVRVDRDGEHARVSVSDRGPGVPRELAERVFEPFFRIEAETGAGVPGTGVGLAVSRGNVEAHGGRIWVEESDGGGARFVFTLPIDPKSAMPPGEG